MSPSRWFFIAVISFVALFFTANVNTANAPGFTGGLDISEYYFYPAFDEETQFSAQACQDANPAYSYSPSYTFSSDLAYSGQGLGEVVLFGDDLLWQIDGFFYTQALATGDSYIRLDAQDYLLFEPDEGQSTAFTISIDEMPVFYVSPVVPSRLIFEGDIQYQGDIASDVLSLPDDSRWVFWGASSQEQLLNGTHHSSIYAVRFERSSSCAKGVNGFVLLIEDHPITYLIKPIDYEAGDIFSEPRLFSKSKYSQANTRSGYLRTAGNQLPFEDIASLPEKISPYTVIPTKNHGYWIIIEVIGGCYETEQIAHDETIDAYRYGSSIYFSCKNAGGSFTVIEMPDTSPTFGLLDRVDMTLGTVLHVDVGTDDDPKYQPWKVNSNIDFDGSYINENVIIYKMNDVYRISFQKTGDPAPVEVEPLFLIESPELQVWLDGNGRVISDPSGINCGNDCDETYETGTNVVLTATPDSGYAFSGWTGSCSGSTATCTIMMNEDKSVTAKFQNASIFSDTAKIPSNIAPNTVITTDNHGMWVVTDGDWILSSAEETSIYAYQEDTETVFSLDSGITFTVIKISADPAPIISSTVRPENINPGTLLKLANGQIWKVTAGSAFGNPGITEDVVIYKMNGKQWISFQTSGISLAVELFSEPFDVDLQVDLDGEGFGAVTSNNLSGISCGSDCRQTFKSRTTVVLLATPDAGYRFTGWTGNCSGSKTTCTLTMDADKSVTATFEEAVIFSDTAYLPSTIAPNTVIVTDNHDMWVVKDGSWTLPSAGEASIYSYQEGTETIFSLDSGITFTVIKMPADASPITSSMVTPENINLGTLLRLQNGQIWKVSEGSASGNSETMEDVVIYAMDGKQWASFQTSGIILVVELLSEAFDVDLQVNLDGEGFGTVTSNNLSGISCGSDCRQTFKSGTTVVLLATPDAGYRFTGWTGSCSGSKTTCTLTMDADKSVTATFEEASVFSDIATFPSNISPNTVIVTKNHGVWVVKDGSWSGTAGDEFIYAYQAGMEMYFSGLDSGIFFNVVEMPDSSPILSSTKALGNINTGTVLALTNGQIWKALDSVAVGSAGETVDIIVYEMDEKQWMCFLTSGLAVEVELVNISSGSELQVSLSGEGTVTSTPTGIDCGFFCNQFFADGSTVKLIAKPDSGYVFSGWMEDCEGSELPCIVTIDAKKSVTAIFEKLDEEPVEDQTFPFTDKARFPSVSG